MASAVNRDVCWAAIHIVARSVLAERDVKLPV